MKLDLLSIKWSEDLFSIRTLLVFGYAFLLGFVPFGFYFMLAFLCYFFAKENEEKYIFFAGYFLACTCQGIVFTYEQVLLVTIWITIVMFGIMIWHNPIHYMYSIGAILIFSYGSYIGMSILDNTRYIVIFLLYAFLLKSLFFKRQEALIFMGATSLLLVYMYYIGYLLSSDAALFLLSLLLVALTSLLKLQYLLTLLILCVVINPLSTTISLYFLPVIAVWALRKENTVSSINVLLIYILLLSIISQNGLYIISGSLFVSVILYINKELIKENGKVKEGLPYENSIHLLRQFSKICKSMVSTGVESSLIQVMAEVFDKSANELATIETYEHFPALIKEALETYQYDIKDIELHYDEALFIKLQLYKTNRSDIRNTLIPILETALHTTLYLQDYQKANLFHSYHECMLVMNPCLQVKYDYFQKAVKDVCGDEINVLSRNEKKVFLLSDGMGEGYQAKSQSHFAIQFLSELFLIGVPFTQMIHLINQFLLLKQSESFATLDILCVDTLSKRCYLYKSGSAQTYLIREGQIHLFEAESLPLGIVSRVAPDVYCFEVKKEDMILLISDGAESEKMMEWLKDIKESKPSSFVKALYERKEKEIIQDDLSILAIRLQNNFHFH